MHAITQLFTIEANGLLVQADEDYLHIFR